MKMEKIIAICSSIVLIGSTAVGCGKVKEEDIEIYHNKHECDTYEIHDIADLFYEDYTSYVDVANDISGFCLYHKDDDWAYYASIPVVWKGISFEVKMCFNEDKEYHSSSFETEDIYDMDLLEKAKKQLTNKFGESYTWDGGGFDWCVSSDADTSVCIHEDDYSFYITTD